ncbi:MULTISPECIES: maltotransferase domain-containing protein [Streptomyces]|uniref:maltotransferase domain-containing protein n=1 Tax=Streptomyces TaxID=1883 RepID=UPI000FFF2829|nr:MULTISPECIES: maltotransferase domain-containing protein [Streptomyces]
MTAVMDPGARVPVGDRIPIRDVRPQVRGGAVPVKAVTGETLTIGATVFREGPGAIGVNVVLRDPDGRPGAWTPMTLTDPDSDRWEATVVAGRPGRWTYSVEAWADPVATWRHDAELKVPAGVDVALTLTEGALLYERAAFGIPDAERREAVRAVARALGDETAEPSRRLAAAAAPEAIAALRRHPLRELVTASWPLPLLVEHRRALVGAWYEMFPRSEGARLTEGAPPVSGTFATAAERLPAIAAMGFDVVYLPPIHPIGRTHRKGPDNALVAGEHDVGSPWAIGSAEGGHDAVHPDLGTLEDFRGFVAAARESGLAVALDFALQCSPDHPWLTEHPEWFTRRADGSVAPAENPPKKYEDIHPLAFDRDFEGLVAESVRLLRFWMDQGVRIFRVDNPHTKPVGFWQRVIATVNDRDPDVVFLAEAFTRRAMVHALAQAGFQQSYTYFTWKNEKEELTEYASELSGESADFLRPNLFVNTPDILHAYLQNGDRPAFEARAVLAATLAPAWGVYAGYELCENEALEPGTEDYRGSEKYELRPRDWAAAEAAGRSIAPLLTRLNELRRTHPALQELRNLRFHEVPHPEVIAYSKQVRLSDGSVDTVLALVNLDPHHPAEGTVTFDLAALGLPDDGSLKLRDELTGEIHAWRSQTYFRLEPGRAPAHLLVPVGERT